MSVPGHLLKDVIESVFELSPRIRILVANTVAPEKFPDHIFRDFGSIVLASHTPIPSLSPNLSCTKDYLKYF